MYAKSITPFVLNDVTAGSGHRARQICNTDFERLQQLFNFFVTNGEATARAINANVNAKRAHVDQWVRGTVNSKARSPTFTRSREPTGAARDAHRVDYAHKLRREELVRRDSLSDMDNVLQQYVQLE
ncbi:hypothetical protein PR003_g17503 [Phytophthora rubi]|uniref:Uncharacterized protein n=1 Tax=Phytophthora rubi TaxID=129364 RepID=A0A6A3KLT3_9STRA|nr:hypothetical protein PR002_g17441 [Phytophthora rubi]KAE9008361.1 hypothetical protein PR001_g16715 [Phytophthora rubi]KAE9321312.1 hypothetical protein PR003_g17503 [Phytophthora rubi]